MGYRAICQSENMERKLETGNQSQNFDYIREIWLPWWGKALLSDYRRKRVVLALWKWATQLFSSIFIFTSHFLLRGFSLLARGGLVAPLIHLINSS